ncbi:MAG: hypothetical protein LBV57_03635 [Candidatus Symbiothrix sp.]|jgi:DNA-binding beta-propeller fold protein YncE|nr:hypothetical protein [Candidatus Symbiothrix sp.]
MNKFSYLFKASMMCVVLAMGFTGCEETPEPALEAVVPGYSGVFILNQGGYNTNDAGISYYNFETGEFQPDIMSGALGATGQDMLIYGSKLYVSVSTSSNITVLDVNTQAVVKRIELFHDDQTPRTPRYLEAYQGKIYASCYDGTVIRLDTLQLAVDGEVAVGEYPEGMAVANGKLYVANSGGMSADGPHNTVSVIDISSFEKELKRITVGLNPYILKADPSGNVYLTYQGNFFDIEGGFQKIDTTNDSVQDLGHAPKQDFVIADGFIYYYDVDYTLVSTGKGSYGKYDLATGTHLPLQIEESAIVNTPYGIGVNPGNQDIYIADANWMNPGNVTIFNKDGAKIRTLSQTGMNPCKFAFY